MANSKGETSGKALELTTEEPQRNRVNKWRLYWFHESDLDANYPADAITLAQALLANPEARMAVLKQICDAEAFGLTADFGALALKIRLSHLEQAAELLRGYLSGSHGEWDMRRVAWVHRDRAISATTAESGKDSSPASASAEDGCASGVAPSRGEIGAPSGAEPAPVAEAPERVTHEGMRNVAKHVEQLEYTEMAKSIRAYIDQQEQQEREVVTTGRLFDDALKLVAEGDEREKALRTKLEGSTLNNGALLRESDSLRAKLSESEREVVELRNALETIREDRRLQRVRAMELDIERDSLRAKLDGSTLNNGALLRESDALRAKLSEAEVEMVELRKKVSQLVEVNMNTATTRDSLQDKLSEAERKLEQSELSAKNWKRNWDISSKHETELETRLRALNDAAADLVAEAVGPYDPPQRGSNLEKLYLLVSRPGPAAKEPTGVEPAKPTERRCPFGCLQTDGGEPCICAGCRKDTPPTAEAEPRFRVGQRMKVTGCKESSIPAACVGHLATVRYIADGAKGCVVTMEDAIGPYSPGEQWWVDFCELEPADPAPPNLVELTAALKAEGVRELLLNAAKECMAAKREGRPLPDYLPLRRTADPAPPGPGGDRPVMMGELVKALRQVEEANPSRWFDALADRLEREVSEKL